MKIKTGMLHILTNHAVYGLLAFCLCTACNAPQGKEAVQEAAITTFRDTAFWQEYHEAYPIPEKWGSAEVRSIAVDQQDNVWIATASGVFRKAAAERTWTHAIPEADQGPSFAVAVDSTSTVWLATWNNLYRVQNGKTTAVAGVQSPLSALGVAREGLYAAGPHGMWLYNGTYAEKKNYTVARSIRDIISDHAGGVWVASDVGLYHCSDQKTRKFTDQQDIISAYVQGVALKGDELWAVGLGGVSILKDEQKIRELRTDNGVPSVRVNCIRRAPDGVMWVGTDVGVVRYDAAFNHTLRFSRRWLLDDQVRDIAFDKQGNAWIATAQGVSVIKRKKMTLAAKARYFYDVLMRRHIRDPWIAGQCRLPVAGDTTHWQPEDDDNDGEYGGNYLAMESFRYAVTKAPDAKEKAARAFGFLKLEQQITGTDGFFARTIVPADWKSVHDGNRVFTDREKADELVKEPRFKPVEVRWHKSQDGRWFWKGDTSSDEICGHMFGYYFYYELVADDIEKAVVGNHVANIVDHLMANNYTLTDIDGQSTRWGVWSPDQLNRTEEWAPDRYLNSMELLSFLKLAHHVTGDEKYQREYLRLIKEEGYLDNMARMPHQNKAWFIYYDVILALYQYPILLGCEKDPKLVRFYEDHLDAFLVDRKADHNPLINFVYDYARRQKAELPASVDFLTDTPLDLVSWPIDHAKREDVRVVREPVLEDLQVSELPPASIRMTVRWDKNPWAIYGADPQVEREPVFWLLPYWMGRYLGMITE
jgi:hypothetical protein